MRRIGRRLFPAMKPTLTQRVGCVDSYYHFGSPYGYATPVAAATARQVSPTASESKGPCPELPAGWQALEDGMGHRYYFHWATGVSQWEFPRA